MITWGLPIWLYLWLAGMAAGAYFAAFLIERFGKIKDYRFIRTASYIGIPFALTGVAFLIIDLGEPSRFWHLLVAFRPTSPMSIGSWLLTLWIAIASLILFLWHTKKWLPIKDVLRSRFTNILYVAGFLVSLFLMGYTGVLLTATRQPLWGSTVALPPLFVTSAVSTGAAVLILVGLITQMWKSHGDIIRRIVQVDAVVIIVELLILGAYMLWLPRSGVPGADESMRRLTTGVLAARFWLGVVLLAILIPFALDIVHWGKRIGEHKTVFSAAIASSTCVIFGALILRAVIVIGGQI
jgi:formate-dependent nitrite reductase membrane component NrfD